MIRSSLFLLSLYLDIGVIEHKGGGFMSEKMGQKKRVFKKKTKNSPVDHHLIEVMIGTLYLWQNLLGPKTPVLQRHPSETSHHLISLGGVACPKMLLLGLPLWDSLKPRPTARLFVSSFPGNVSSLSRRFLRRDLLARSQLSRIPRRRYTVGRSASGLSMFPRA